MMRNKQIKSEYWRNVLRNQWLLALQGIVIVIVVLTMGTWGHQCKEDIVENGPVALWRLVIERLREIIIDIGPELRLKLQLLSKI